jgi:hypothetical protein
MEHNGAVKTKAVERYLLGEMLQDERDEFEEHYFACKDCAQDVRAGARFRANAREWLKDLRQFADVEEPRRGFSWWRFPAMAPVAVSVLLLGVVVYQSGFEIPSLKRQLGTQAPAEGAIAVLLRATTRGAEGAAQIPRGSGLVSLHFDILPDMKESAYECTIMDASGRVMAVPTVESPKGDEPAIVQLRREYFPPGRYTLAVRGASGGTLGSTAPRETLAKYEFEIH